MSKEQVEETERNAFKKWLDGIYAQHPKNRLNYFEHNLEVCFFDLLMISGLEAALESLRKV